MGKKQSRAALAAPAVAAPVEAVAGQLEVRAARSAEASVVAAVGMLLVAAVTLTALKAGEAREQEALEVPKQALGTSIIRPPLFRLDRIARFFWSKKTYDRVFGPNYAELVHEWMEAEVAGHRRRAWYIKWIRGPYMQLSHMAKQVPWSIVKRIADMVRAAIK